MGILGVLDKYILRSRLCRLKEMSGSRSWCCGNMCKVKVILLVCVLGLLVNYLVFLQFHMVAPRSLLIVLNNRRADATTTPPLTPSVPASGLRPSHRPPTVKIAIGKDPLEAAAGNTSVAKIHNTSVPVPLVVGNASRVPEGGKEKTGNGSSALPVGIKLSDWRQGKVLNASNVTQPVAAAAAVAVPKELPVCPEKPPDLVGRFATYLTPVQMSRVEQKYPQVTKGGHYHPPDCKAREKLAIVIPCRNREEHLAILLNNLLGMLIKQKLDFSIFIIDQDLPTTFNRGMLFNVGYLEALKHDNYDCFIFHDVDMIPTNDNCFYRCTHHPRHFIGALSKWQYGLLYHRYYGGVVSFTRDQYRKINGGSNLFFGWGGEDDDLLTRVLSKGYSMVRYPKMIGRYDTPSHKRDNGNGDNPQRFQLVSTSKARQDKEGLSTTTYKVTEFLESQLFTKIKVFINMTQILHYSKRYR